MDYGAPQPHSPGFPLAVTEQSTALLDNPIWNALRTEHAGIALGDGRARRYPSHIGPLSGIPDQDSGNYAALAMLAPEDIAVLFSLEPFRIPAGWEVLRALELVQMVRPRPAVGAPGFDSAAPDAMRPDPQIQPLTAADAQEMVALAELTKPGPFRLGTLELGGFVGIFENGRLLSMAGRRLHLPGMVEVSGVCTHPESRGRGYAKTLMERVIEEIEREGKTAFLHSLPDNPAIRLYEQLGFGMRASFRWVVLKPALE